ncbi:MAG: D-alanyl-D-alanine carboxypeptidase/D-alanyl-D-alanine-endopeptidase [Propionibacteriaceae bacterium]|jgi:D-alanyl-D-alanine carboxypeptidase/D-alanyl-D-alanine-endopeptidase (penicillin-binding protein 4)|nr:D-alanyl-D-alanine carboxypeptidase/D-alanyl-D-alanine-endopeptidase [Propionibacteriaceae bacterium]
MPSQPLEASSARRRRWRRGLTAAGLAGLLATAGLAGPTLTRWSGLTPPAGAATIDPLRYATPAPTPTPQPGPSGLSVSSARSTLDPAQVAAGLAAAGAVAGSLAWAVLDPADGRVLAQREDQAALVPASCLKILTGAAVLASLGPTHRFVTRTVWSGDDLVLVGGGDPYLTASSPSDYPNRASLVDLAEATAEGLRRAGRTSLAVGWDDSLFTGPDWNPSWPASYSSEAVPTSALWLDRGRQAGVRSRTPAADAGAAFVQELRQRGIEVQPLGRVLAPAQAVELARVESAPLDLVVQEMLRYSDNDVAEALFRHIALAAGRDGSIAAAQAAMAERLGQLGLWSDGMVIDDGSGLSRANRATASALALAVVRAVRRTDLRAVWAGLPVAAGDGTLRTRFDSSADGPGRGRVRAKTGTLNGVHTLTGLVQTRSGSVLALSLLVNQAVDAAAARDWLDRAAAELAAL